MALSWVAAAAITAGLSWYCSRSLRGGLYALMMAVPLSYKDALKGSPLYYLVELIILALLVGTFLRNREAYRLWRRAPFVVWVPFLVYIALSVLWADSAAAVGKEVVRWAEFFVVILLVTHMMKGHSDYPRPVIFLGWVGAVVSVTGIIQFLFGLNQAPYRPGAAAFFTHPNPTAAFLCLCFMPIVGLVVQGNGRNFIERLFIFFFLLLGLAFTFSRGILLAVIMGSLLFVLSLDYSPLSWHRRVLMLLLATALTVGGLFGSPRFRETAVGRFIVQPLFSERQSILALGWSLYKERPLLGLGAGNLKHHAAKHDIRVFDGLVPFDNVGDLHNLYLQLAVETGAIGLLLFLSGLLSFLVITMRRKKNLAPSSEPLFWAIAAASIAFFAGNMTGVYTIKGIHLICAVLLGLQAAITDLDTSYQRS